MSSLTAKQEAFCTEYVRTWNATHAAKAAGYSEKTAYAIGWENLRKPEIAARINELIIAAGEGASVTQAWVLHRLILEASTAEKGSERIRALELLGKHLAMFTDKVQVEHVPDSATVQEWIDAMKADIDASHA